MSLPSEPGIARADIDPNGKGCRLVWENDTVSLTDQVAKMSTRSGLIYAVTRKYDTEVPGYEPPDLDVYRVFFDTPVSLGRPRQPLPAIFR